MTGPTQDVFCLILFLISHSHVWLGTFRQLKIDNVGRKKMGRISKSHLFGGGNSFQYSGVFLKKNKKKLHFSGWLLGSWQEDCWFHSSLCGLHLRSAGNSRNWAWMSSSQSACIVFTCDFVWPVRLYKCLSHTTSRAQKTCRLFTMSTSFPGK